MTTSSHARDTQSSAIGVRANKLGKLIRVQDASENLQAIDDAWTRSGEIGIRINNVDPAVSRGGKRFKPWEHLEQLVIGPRLINIVSTER